MSLSERAIAAMSSGQATGGREALGPWPVPEEVLCLPRAAAACASPVDLEGRAERSAEPRPPESWKAKATCVGSTPRLSASLPTPHPPRSQAAGAIASSTPWDAGGCTQIRWAPGDSQRRVTRDRQIGERCSDEVAADGMLHCASAGKPSDCSGPPSRARLRFSTPDGRPRYA
jgi:hypothetical protein